MTLCCAKTGIITHCLLPQQQYKGQMKELESKKRGEGTTADKEL